MSWITRDEESIGGTGREVLAELRDECYTDGEVAGVLVAATVALVNDTDDPEGYLEDIIEAMRDALGG